MGKVSATAETVFNYPREVVWDFATNPNNWGHSFDGSGGLTHEVALPVKFGDAFTEHVGPAPQAYALRWTAVRVQRPYQFTIQAQNGIGERVDGSSPGVDGFCDIKYTFEATGDGGTLFTRILTIELPRGTRVPDDLLTASCQTWVAEKYHDSIRQQLDQQHRGSARQPAA